MEFLAVLGLLCSTATVGVGTNVNATMRVPSFLSSHMVLQRGNATVWGWAAAGARVMVLANDTTGELASATTIATDAGTWSVSLSVGIARPTSTVTIASSGQPTIVLEDVAWGDVFLCSGQSNMEYFVADAFYGDAERNASSHPSLRMLNLADVAVKDVDATDCPSKAPYTWAASAPVLQYQRMGFPQSTTVACLHSVLSPQETLSPRDEPGNPSSFGDRFPSAVCWFAARDLVLANPSVPIGIITAAKSGSPIEVWMLPGAILDGTPAVFGGNGSCGGAVTPPARPAVSPRTATCPQGGPNAAGSYFRGMIAPLTPMRITGVWWYQGEENDHSTDACPGPVWYRCLFPAMITSWRAAFRIPELPFFYILLAGGHTAVMREAQVAGASAIRNTWFASAVDLGAAPAEFLVPGHPPRKQEVGRRLSLAVLGTVYRQVIDYLGPSVIVSGVRVVQSTGSSGEPVTTVTLPFDVGANGFLHLNGTGGYPNGCISPNETARIGDVTGYAGNPVSPVGVVDWDAAGSAPVVVKSTTFHVVGTTLVAVFPGWKSTNGRVQVQFLFDDHPLCALYNGELSGPDSVYAANPHLGVVAQSWRGNITSTDMHQ